MKKLLVLAVALLGLCLKVEAQTTYQAESVNAASEYGLLAHYPGLVNVHYTCGVGANGGAVTITYTSPDGVMHFSPVLPAACSNVTVGNEQQISFTSSESYTLSELAITANPGNFTNQSGPCGRSGCQWHTLAGYNLSIMVN